jgi:hypothetical protein
VVDHVAEGRFHLGVLVEDAVAGGDLAQPLVRAGGGVDIRVKMGGVVTQMHSGVAFRINADQEARDPSLPVGRQP